MNIEQGAFSSTESSKKPQIVNNVSVYYFLVYMQGTYTLARENTYEMPTDK